MMGEARAPAGPIVKPRLSRHVYRLVGAGGGVILVLLIVMALFPGAVAPYDPWERVARPFLSPGPRHLLGTNDIGQDLLSELIWGTRISLLTGLLVSMTAVPLGTVVGLIGGYFSNALSSGLMRLVDLTLILPFLPLIIVLGAYLGAGQDNVIAILVLVSWAGPARLVRSRVLTVRRLPYIEAARALGSSDGRILRQHIWPGVRGIVVVQAVLVAASSILAEASLSFLGLGDPARKSWGTMLYFAQASGAFLSDAWQWWVLPAGLMITLSVLSLILVSYALERRAEPQLRG
jgi:ABC-type dipeptide/oligopeptide/nickel transport system permease subunit